MNNEVVNTPPRAAATVVMLRHVGRGLEIFLVKRHGRSNVLAGAHVFPGGKVDVRDAHPAALALLDQPHTSLATRLGEPDGPANSAASLFFAAAREAFEESGVLLAHGADRERTLRAAAMLREGQPFDDVLRALALQLDTGNMQPWSRWITPRVPTVTNQRFDTRFFVTALPPCQIASHDNHEAIESEWLRPDEALKRYWDGSIDLAPPQILSLTHLAQFAHVDEVLAALRLARPVLVEPQPFDVDGERMICYPGDERHARRERVLHGPTRLYHRKGRFEPVGGFKAFFEPSSGPRT